MTYIEVYRTFFNVYLVINIVTSFIWSMV